MTVILAIVGIVVWRELPGDSGDPGGQVMDQLMSAAYAVPGYGTPALPVRSAPPINGPYLTKMEPHQDSCDGMTGTGGWSQVVVQAGFAWSGSTVALTDYMNSTMVRHGWTVGPSAPPGAQQEWSWTKQLNGEVTAQAQLMQEGPDWQFTATAPPIGTGASGC
jgi:hypothetical protein